MKVLVALDGGETSFQVLPAARRVRELIPDAEVHLLTVLDPSKVKGKFQTTPRTEAVGTTAGLMSVPPPAPAQAESHGAAMRRKEMEVRESLEARGKQEFPGVVVTVHVEWSDKPADAVVICGETLKADVIAMATHGRTGLAHAFAGSITEEVIRKSTRPILVVGPFAAK
jgi:nucleotide-binding universal stress UspA family protein